MIKISNLVKRYPHPSGKPFTALNEIKLTISKGEFVAIVGKSGSGKSTLLNLITGIDQPTQGSIEIEQQAIHQFSEAKLAKWRGENVGIVFQFFQLLPTLTVLENLLLAMDFVNKIPTAERTQRARQILEQMGIGDQMDKLPSLLSGGQQQRAAIARSLANDPDLIVADEPTGNLDSQNAAAILSLFQQLLSQGKTLILVTHDLELAQKAKRIVHLADGEIIDQQINHNHDE